MLARRLLIAGGGGGGGSAGTLLAPYDWTIAREATNPVIDVADNPAETLEQYTPGPIRLASGDVWVYVKGLDRIYAWKSTDDGVTFSLQNGGAGVLVPVPATWEASFVVDPGAVYDLANDTIHLFYKARDGGVANWQWGHATAPGSTPTVFTRDGANPILTKANAQTQLGGGTTRDLSLTSVIKIGSTFHFYGYGEYDSGSGFVYRLLHATGTTWNDPSGLTILLSAVAPDTVVESPSVYLRPGGGGYGMFYARGTTLSAGRTIRWASSTDGTTWDFSNTTNVLSPTSGWEANSVYSGAFIMESASPWSSPVYIDSTWRYYYSGYTSVNGHANVGLAFLTPTWS